MVQFLYLTASGPAMFDHFDGRNCDQRLYMGLFVGCVTKVQCPRKFLMDTTIYHISTTKPQFVAANIIFCTEKLLFCCF